MTLVACGGPLLRYPTGPGTELVPATTSALLLRIGRRAVTLPTAAVITPRRRLATFPWIARRRAAAASQGAARRCDTRRCSRSCTTACASSGTRSSTRRATPVRRRPRHRLVIAEAVIRGRPRSGPCGNRLFGHGSRLNRRYSHAAGLLHDYDA